MTGNTIGRSAFEDTVLVARTATHIGMRAGQFERRKIMVEGGIFPTGCGVA